MASVDLESFNFFRAIFSISIFSKDLAPVPFFKTIALFVSDISAKACALRFNFSSSGRLAIYSFTLFLFSFSIL